MAGRAVRSAEWPGHPVTPFIRPASLLALVALVLLALAGPAGSTLAALAAGVLEGRGAASHLDAVPVPPLVPIAAPMEQPVPATPEHPAYTLYAPGGPLVPRTPLLVLHGIGGNGPGMASLLQQFAMAEGWVIIAPTISYGDWRDPNALTGEELSLIPQLAKLLDSVPVETGVPLARRALLFGFSRGAQEALRFTLLYPERVEGVAAFSAGTYTLPVATVQGSGGTVLPAPFPFGIAGLEQRLGHPIDPSRLAGVRFLIGVGEGDNVPADVPRQWDSYVGTSRLERAQRFTDALRRLGCRAEMAVIPGVKHELTGATLQRVTAFLEQVDAEAQSLAEATLTDPPAVPAGLRSRPRAGTV